MSSCNEKQYPYPDENIFFITGVETEVVPVDYSKTFPLIIVSRKVEVALAKYEDLGRLHQAKPIGCLSLAQIRALHSRLAASMTDPQTKELKGNLFGAMLGKRQPWLIASKDAAGQPTVVDFVIARSSKDVLAHAKRNNRVSPTIYPLELYEEMVSLCEEVKHGEAEKMLYAIDYKGGELKEQIEAEKASWTEEERAKAERELDEMADARAKGLI